MADIGIMQTELENLIECEVTHIWSTFEEDCVIFEYLKEEYFPYYPSDFPKVILHNNVTSK